MSTDNTLMYGPDYLRGLAEADSKENQRKAEQRERKKLQGKANVARQLKDSDVLQALQYYVKTNHDNALERMFDPTRRKEGETTESLRVEVLVHKQYVDIFSLWEREGELAMKALMEKGEG